MNMDYIRVIEMLDFDEMRELLQANIPAKRYKHSLNVYETAVELAALHGLPSEKIAVAALLHDCGREVSARQSVALAQSLGIEMDEIEEKQPILLHAKLGVYNARAKYGVTDEEILAGIRWHTTGGSGMSKLAQVVYLADMIEPKRDFPGISPLRAIARRDLAQAMQMAFGGTLRYLLSQGLLIHPDCIAAYNEITLALKARDEQPGEQEHGRQA